MNGARPAWNAVLLFLAGVSLFAGLVRLDMAQHLSVFIILGAMGFLMFPAASLRGAAAQDTGRAGIGNRIKHCGGALASTTRRT